MKNRIDAARRLRERSQTILEKTRRSVLRARAINIQALHLAEQARAVRYENRLIRGSKR